MSHSHYVLHDRDAFTPCVFCMIQCMHALWHTVNSDLQGGIFPKHRAFTPLYSPVSFTYTPLTTSLQACSPYRCFIHPSMACAPIHPIHPSVACAPRDPRSQTRPWSLHNLIPYIPPWLARPYIPPGLRASRSRGTSPYLIDLNRIDITSNPNSGCTQLQGLRALSTWLARHPIHPSMACAPRDPRPKTRPWSLHYLKPHHSEIQRNESMPVMIS